MFMRFRGGGVGHRITRHSEHQLMESDAQQEIGDGEGVGLGYGAPTSAPPSDDEQSEPEGERENDFEDDEADLGAEDGESSANYIGEDTDYADL